MAGRRRRTRGSGRTSTLDPAEAYVDTDAEALAAAAALYALPLLAEPCLSGSPAMEVASGMFCKFKRKNISVCIALQGSKWISVLRQVNTTELVHEFIKLRLLIREVQIPQTKMSSPGVGQRMECIRRAQPTRQCSGALTRALALKLSGRLWLKTK
ncbi:uncharacterized protein LOC119278094 [Triticum dicoccoides]|uniref:uncharacterized protein LOC119278094 n=1 Tax=Triticum dicoccoides TaxID=85692 RepID=UPI00188E62F0|nr:uncharacterized protein LOC119278094 [Triticum dicoccoides]